MYRNNNGLDCLIELKSNHFFSFHMPVCIIAISSYCLAVAIREFMKSVNGYPPPQGELILLNVTPVYPQ